MDKSIVLILTYHVDPEHGWIEVSETIVDQLGIKDKISEYSYYSFTRKSYFLEEDFDAGLLLQALKDRGIEYVIRNKEHKGEAFIRKLNRVSEV